MWENIFSVASCGRSSSVRKTKATEGSGTMLCVSLQQKHWSRGKRETHPRDICVGQNGLKINAWHRCQWVIQYWTAQAIGTSSADRTAPVGAACTGRGFPSSQKRREKNHQPQVVKRKDAMASLYKGTQSQEIDGSSHSWCGQMPPTSQRYGCIAVLEAVSERQEQQLIPCFKTSLSSSVLVEEM